MCSLNASILKTSTSVSGGSSPVGHGVWVWPGSEATPTESRCLVRDSGGRLVYMQFVLQQKKICTSLVRLTLSGKSVSCSTDTWMLDAVGIFWLHRRLAVQFESLPNFMQFQFDGFWPTSVVYWLHVICTLDPGRCLLYLCQEKHVLRALKIVVGLCFGRFVSSSIHTMLKRL